MMIRSLHPRLLEDILEFSTSLRVESNSCLKRWEKDFESETLRFESYIGHSLAVCLESNELGSMRLQFLISKIVCCEN